MSTFLIFVFLLLTSLSVNSVMFALLAFVSSASAVTNYVCSFILGKYVHVVDVIKFWKKFCKNMPIIVFLNGTI